MLSQKLTKEVLLFYYADSKIKQMEYKKDLIFTFNTWQKVHNSLINGNKELNLPGNNSSEIQIFFKEMKPYYQALSTNTLKLLNLHNINSSELNNKQKTVLINNIVKNSPLFLKWMDKIVFRYEKEAFTRVEKLKSYQIWVVILVLLILVFESILIFKPMIKKIQQNFIQIQKQSSELKQTQKMKVIGQLAAGVAHEINNLMTVIVGNNELAIQEFKKTDSNNIKAIKFLTEITSSVSNESCC